MNIPGDPRDVSAPIDGEAATPVFDSRPPYDGAGEAKQHKTAAADTMNKAARGSYQQVFVKAHEPLDDGVPSQFVAKNNRAAGSTHKQDVSGGYRSQPKMHLEEDVAYE